jgi:hypothetical protein
MRPLALVFAYILGLPTAALSEQRQVFLEAADGIRIFVAELSVADDGTYSIDRTNGAYNDHFLSMRPFKCLEGPQKHWCHVPYPYEIQRDISDDLVDLEYDFLFLWKGSTEYGINMWNGVYYKLERTGKTLTGTLHEMDMDLLSAPPPPGELRPIKAQDIHESDPDSHWLPRLVIE